MAEHSPESRGPVALVTGASSGIGLSIATRLAREGYHVIATARREERLTALSQSEPNITPWVADLRDARSVHRLFESTRKAFGGVEVLINNAGLGRHAPLMESNGDAWREMLEVNVLALSLCTAEAIQDMRANGDRGHIVHISSMSAHRVPALSGMYSATKYAVRSLTEGLRTELRAANSSIRVSSISPGFVETEFAEVYTGSSERATETYSRFTVLQPEDIADMVSYALRAPAHVEIHDMLVRPTAQPS